MTIFRNFKYTVQTALRKNHISDIRARNVGYTLGPSILEHLKAFRKLKLKGVPSYFTDWTEEQPLGLTEAEYDELCERGRFGGGGMDAWLDVLDEMIFSFEFNLNESDADFYTKHGYKDPFREEPDNMKTSFTMRDDKGKMCIVSEDWMEEKGGSQAVLDTGYELIHAREVYFDYAVLDVVALRAQKGNELFGKFYWNLWD